MSRRIKIFDQVGASESRYMGGLYGEVLFGKGRHTVHFRDPFGKDCVRS